ncbi:MAG: glycosyl transferase, partial [Cyclobacteriaceae bacterium]|nr:glycosyl transferase [Cyclobacteriaceae bacterium]
MTKKKVLIITYYWPPSGGGGVQRWLKMAKYLPTYGWEPIIFTPQNPDFELKDEGLLKDVATDTKVLKLPIWEPFGLYRKLMGKNAVQKQ